MAPATPLDRLLLVATSVADDVGYVALSDLSQAVGSEPPGNYCVIGGHMVTALVARWQLGSDLYRETGDTDVGVAPRSRTEGGPHPTAHGPRLHAPSRQPLREDHA